MTDLVTAMLARKHRLLHARDQLDYQITSLCTAIDALQLTETTPEAPHPEVEQPEAATAPPAALPKVPLAMLCQHGNYAWVCVVCAKMQAAETEKAATAPDAPPQQPEVEAPPKPPAAPIERALPLAPLVAEGLPEPREERGGWLTPARRELLREFYPKRAITSREVMGKLAASPGPRIPDWGNISRYAIDVLGLPAANRSHSQQPNKSAAAQPISYNDLIAKAAEWGITEIHPDDLLEAVNAKAVRIGHKPYALQSRSP